VKGGVLNLAAGIIGFGRMRITRPSGFTFRRILFEKGS